MSVIFEKKDLITATKQQFIVDATVKLIGNKYISEITMDDIANASAYTKRTLYTYFKSKDEILLWAYTDSLVIRWEYQKELIATEDSGLDKLIMWGLSLFRYYNKNRYSFEIQRYMDYVFVQTDKVGSSILERFELLNHDMINGLREIFELGIIDKSIRSDVDIDLCIHQFVYSLRAIVGRAFSDNYSFAKFDSTEYVNHFLDQIVFYLKPER